MLSQSPGFSVVHGVMTFNPPSCHLNVLHRSPSRGMISEMEQLLPEKCFHFDGRVMLTFIDCVCPFGMEQHISFVKNYNPLSRPPTSYLLPEGAHHPS